MADDRVEVLASECLHAGRIFDVLRERVRLPSGLEVELEFVRHGGAVAIAARRDDGRLVLVRQYRHATGEMLLEVPAGRLEPGEEPEQAARRELEEETGLRAARWRELARFYAAPGFCSERLVLFLAEGLEDCGPERRAADPDEEFEVHSLAPAQVLAQARDAKTLLAALLCERGQT
ncbi:MAG TPA: NUDIX hydrolase [Planctomycetota bacterium]|nr:NUDIX hydrolase [Planctomycetota bacterium]